MSGKGDSPRPLSVPKEVFDENWKQTFEKISDLKIQHDKGFIHYDQNTI